jgi:uncharacterized protein (TIGR00369 family)
MIATALDRLETPPASRLLGWHLLDALPGKGWVRVGFDGKPEFCNPAGFIQGGILTAMLDDTMGPAVFVMTEGRLYTATITMTVNFLAPAKPGPIVGEASVAQIGKTIAFVEARLKAADGGVIATATASARLVETAKAIPGPRVATLSRIGTDNSHDRRRPSLNPGSSALAVVEVALALVRGWRERRRMRCQLAVMSERELQDMGICRSEIAFFTGRVEVSACSKSFPPPASARSAAWR